MTPEYCGKCGANFATPTAACEHCEVLARARNSDLIDAVFTHQQLALWSKGWQFIGDRLDKPSITTSGHATAPLAIAAAAKEVL